MVARCTRQAGTSCVDSNVILQFKNEQNYWRKLLERILCVITFLCERGLALRGRDEMTGSPKNGYFGGTRTLRRVPC